MGTAHLDITVFTTIPRIEPDASPEDVVTVNFVADGVTAFGKVWYRGEELHIQRDTPWWHATIDNKGTPWVEYSDAQQRRVYGKVRFALGPWSGGGFDLDDDALDDA